MTGTTPDDAAAVSPAPAAPRREQVLARVHATATGGTAVPIGIGGLVLCTQP